MSSCARSFPKACMTNDSYQQYQPTACIIYEVEGEMSSQLRRAKQPTRDKSKGGILGD